MGVSLPILRDVHGGTGLQFLAFLGAVIPLTLLAAELLHRLVERPFIALGARLARGTPRAAMPAG
jgi:peptidoglycan/LPS O-acetylase OafA/YrhL